MQDSQSLITRPTTLTTSKVVEYLPFIVENSPPFANINVMKTPKNYHLEFHSHDFYHVNRVLKGELSVFIDNKQYDLPTGTIFCLPPNVPHSLYSKDGYVQIGMDIECNNDSNLLYAEFKNLSSNFNFITIPITEIEASLKIEQMKTLLSSPTIGNTLRALNLAESQLLDFLEKLRPNNSSEFTARFNKLAKTHQLWELSLNDICKLLLISRTEIERQAKKNFGCGVYEYCARLRFAKACELLQNGISISEIASALSFFDEAHFSRFFTKRAKMPPGEYRKTIH